MKLKSHNIAFDSAPFRVMNTLTRVSGHTIRCELRYVIFSIHSIVKKIVYRYLSDSLRGSMFRWIFNDCIINVKFRNVQFCFQCPRNSTFVMYMNPYTHEYDISTFLTERLGNGDVFVDVGAMGGKYSIIASRIVGERGKVFSVEPNPVNLKALQTNIRLNNLKNVTIIGKAVGNRNDAVTFYYNDGATETTSIHKNPEHTRSFKAEIRTLDSLLDGLPSVKLLKVDCEGCDADVLEGAARLLGKTSYVIVEENNERTREILGRSKFTLTLSHLSKYLIATNLHEVGTRVGAKVERAIS